MCVCVCVRVRVCACGGVGVVISVQSEGVARSPAVFGAMVSYIRDVLDVFGIDLLYSKVRAQGFIYF